MVDSFLTAEDVEAMRQCWKFAINNYPRENNLAVFLVATNIDSRYTELRRELKKRGAAVKCARELEIVVYNNYRTKSTMMCQVPTVS